MRATLRAGTALLAATALAGTSLVGIAAPAGAATSVTCTPADQGLGPDATWSLALGRLDALVDPARTFPFGATGRGPYIRTSAYQWTSGFFPASLWLAYQRTGDRQWLARARAATASLAPVARWTGSHDLGFMVGLPVGLAAALDPSAARRARSTVTLDTAARSLASRWNGRVGAVKSGDYGGRWGVIIDSAMNMPMLLEAGARVGGTEGAVLRARATSHLRLLARDFVRTDGTTVHRQAYDPATGRLLGPVPGQGLSPSSTWARGQAWAMAGFADGYRLTADPALLDAARRTADAWLTRVPPGCIPAWDLDVSAASAPRDSSAAAIAAYGLQRLSRVEPDPARAAQYASAAGASIDALTAPTWLGSRPGTHGLLQRQTWNVPADRREGTYAWGDAYLLLALSERASSTG